MIRKIAGNLWTWVVLMFLLLIGAWVWTIWMAAEHGPVPLEEGESVERQEPPPVVDS